MAPTTLTSRIARKGSNKPRLAKLVAREPARIPELFAGLESPKADLRYGCLKTLRLLSENSPERLYPYFGQLARLLDSPNTIFQWGAIIIIGNLAGVDSQGDIDKLLGRFLAPITGPIMITAANVIGAAAKIALAKPALADTIAREILKVEMATYKTTECRNIACGHAITAFNCFLPLVKDKAPITAFVQRQLTNTRNATRKKAERFLRKLGTARDGPLAGPAR